MSFSFSKVFRCYSFSKALVTKEKQRAIQFIGSSLEFTIIIIALLIYITFSRVSPNISPQGYFPPLLFFGIGLLTFIAYIKISLTSLKIGYKANLYVWINALPIWFCPIVAGLRQASFFSCLMLAFLMLSATFRLMNFVDIGLSIIVFLLGQITAILSGLILWVICSKVSIVSLITRIAYRRSLLLLSAVVATSQSLERLTGRFIYYNPLLQTIECLREAVNSEYSTSCSIESLTYLALALAIFTYLLLRIYTTDLRALYSQKHKSFDEEESF
jgi:hypothetical protein